MTGKQKAILAVGILVAIMIVSGGTVLWRGLGALDAIEVANVDLRQVKDGVYVGECSTPLVSAVVQVIVQDGKISAVEVLHHSNGRGKAAESIVDAVVERQSLNVDAISGATMSSKVILKAIENALQ